ncbi:MULTISPECIES: hypothetical protein [unclassified Aureimonas]|uniref:hypothetical protein n=1 Tax=unclassified Aureimonas TaxID=2615206 RepID=UPI00071EC4DA|nr:MULTISPECIES: hypothetical protein [unclassified Aureimonas]ALN75469.1 hypothetical protein M673_22265 [Aureimonas sp. AU20]
MSFSPPADRYTIQRDEAGTWNVLDLETELPATVRDRILVAMPIEEARDAAAMLNIIDSWRRESSPPLREPTIQSAIASYLGDRP